MKPGRPLPDEFAPIAQRYVDLVEDEDPRRTLAGQHEKTMRLLRSMDEEYATTFAYAAGKWTVKEIVGHLSDAERIFAYRALRLIRGDQTPLPGFEQDDYVAAGEANRRKYGNLLDELSAVRQASLALFADMPDDAWLRRGKVSDWNLSVRGILFTMAGHELHHFKILQGRYLPPK